MSLEQRPAWEVANMAALLRLTDLLARNIKLAIFPSTIITQFSEMIATMYLIKYKMDIKKKALMFSKNKMHE